MTFVKELVQHTVKPITLLESAIDEDVSRNFVNLVLTANITELAGEYIDSHDMSNLQQVDYVELIKYFPGLLACIIIGLLYILLVPLGGLILCGCNVCGKRKVENKRNNKISCWYWFWRGGAVIFSCMVLISGAFLLEGNSYVDKAVGNLKLLVNEINEGAKDYAVNTVNQLQSYKEDFGTFRKATLDELENEEFGNNIQEITMNALGPTQQELDVLQTGFLDAKVQITSLAESVKLLKDEIDVFKNELDAFKNLGCGCTDSVCDNKCDTVTVNTQYITDAYSNLNTAKYKLENDEVFNIDQDVQDEINKISTTIKATTDDIVAEISASNGALTDAENTMQTEITRIEDLVDSYFDPIAEYKRTIDSILDTVDTANKYRSGVYVALGVIILLISVITLVGCAVKNSWAPPFLKTSITLGFVFGGIFMICVIITFTAGSLLDRYGCQGFHYSSIDEQNIEVLRFIEDQAGIDILLNQSLRSCKKNTALAKALELEKQFEEYYPTDKLSQQLDEKITVINDTFDGILADLNIDGHLVSLQNFETYPELSNGKEHLKLSYDNLNVLKTSLDDFANAGDLQESLISAQIEHNQMIQSTENFITKTINLKEITDSVAEKLNVFNSDKITLRGDIFSRASFIKNYALQYAGELKNSLVNEFGRCQPIYQSYANVVDLVCSYGANPINSLWLTLGWAAAFLIPLLIFANQYLREVKRSSLPSDNGSLMYMD